MRFYGINKEEVLNQIYIRELPLIVQQISKKKLEDQKVRLYDYQMMLNIGTITAGIAPNANAIKDLSNTITQELRSLSGKSPVYQNQFDEVNFNKLKMVLTHQEVRK